LRCEPPVLFAIGRCKNIGSPHLVADLPSSAGANSFYWYSGYAISALTGVYVFGRRREPMASKTDDERRAIALSSGRGTNALVFDDDDVVHLLRAAIEREGSQIAFAKRYGVNRAYLIWF
jgi:hypothetical protein